MKKFSNIFILFLMISFCASAQLPSHLESNVLDGVYVQEHVPTKRVVQYTYLREADVMWSKRIWRIIDLREKQNHQLYYPLTPISDRMALWDVIRQGVLNEGSITCYELGLDLDDQFRFPIKPANGNINDPDYKKKLEEKFGKATSFTMRDDEGEVLMDDEGNEIKKDTVEPYFAKDIIRYEIKEDWFFDKQRSVMDVRIIGISPVVYFVNPETNNVEGVENLFWLYFPECRYMFQNYFVYNPQNDAQRMSFDDFFWKREFSSYIKKESNVFDRQIYPNWKGVDALLESEKIKERMFDIEHDVWHF
jgi:gliding motility associated protien GldN